MVATVMERKMINSMSTNKEWTARELRVLLTSYNYPASLLQKRFFNYRSVNSVSYKLNEVKEYINARASYFNAFVDAELVQASYTRNIGMFYAKYNIPKKYVMLRLVELGVAR